MKPPPPVSPTAPAQSAQKEMKGLKTIRTSNWDAMITFYRDSLGMRERDHDSKDSLREFVDFGTEIHLERANAKVQHEVLGSLELYSSDPAGLAAFLLKKGLGVGKRAVSGRTELILSDPDGNVLTIVQEAHKT